MVFPKILTEQKFQKNKSEKNFQKNRRKKFEKNVKKNSGKMRKKIWLGFIVFF